MHTVHRLGDSCSMELESENSTSPSTLSTILKRAQAQRTASANMQSRVVHHTPFSRAGWATHAQSHPLARPADTHAPVHAPNLIY